MTCDGCGNTEAHRLSYSPRGQSCDKCSKTGSFRFSDVYFKGPYFDPNIAHDTKFPRGSEIRTREQKAALMRELGISEAGDRQHGAR